jgi:hypothetical protein
MSRKIPNEFNTLLDEISVLRGPAPHKVLLFGLWTRLTRTSAPDPRLS